LLPASDSQHLNQNEVDEDPQRGCGPSVGKAMPKI
jgi:hypothetical protein